MKRRVRPFVTLAVCVLVAACGGCGSGAGELTTEIETTAQSTPDDLPVPGHEFGTRVEEALIVGKLVTLPETTRSGCLGLEVEGEAYLLLIPDGYRVRLDSPAELIDDDGIVAVEGDELSIGGGFHERADSECEMEGPVVIAGTPTVSPDPD